MTSKAAPSGAYVLKFVQAAVALGTNEISVKVTRTEFQLSFESASLELASLGDIAAELSLPRARQGSALRHLVLGLKASGGPMMREALWQSPQGTLRLSGDIVETLPDTHSSYRLVLRKDRPRWLWFLGSMFTAETSLLSQRCRFAPVRLVLDGLEAPRYPWNRFGDDIPMQFGLAQPHLLLDFRCSGQGIELSYPPSEAFCEQPSGLRRWTGNRASPKTPSSAAVPLLIAGWDGSSLTMPARAAIGIPSAAFGPGRVWPVLHGVSLDPLENLELGLPGVQVVIDVSDMSTGDSELELERDARLSARLEEARNHVKAARDTLRREDLRQALQAGGMLESQWGPVVHRTWQAFDGSAVAPALLELLTHFLAVDKVFLGSALGADKTASIQQNYASILAADEVILGLFEGSFLVRGFVITNLKLCWAPLSYLYWDEIPETAIKPEDHGLGILGTSVPLVSRPDLRDALVRFLSEVASLPLPPAHLCSPTEKTVLNTALKTLQRVGGLNYHPHISESQVALARRRHGARWPAEERALLMGEHSEHRGWLVTEHRFLWVNPFTRIYKGPFRFRFQNAPFERPNMIEWSAFTPDDVRVTYEGLKIGSRRIEIWATELREPLAAFLKAMATAAAGRQGPKS